jgi:energy-coupling factor transport system permease protein
MAMLKDISFGQFLPGNSVVHRIDPRVKLIFIFVYVVVIFLTTNAISLLFTAIVLIGAFIISNIPLKLMFKSIKGILPIIILTTVLNAFYIKGDVLFKIWVLVITKQGLFTAATICVRIILVIICTSLLTFTTSPIVLTDGLEKLLSPLKVIRLDVHSLAMMMTIALRFIPTLIEETDKIMSAQKARGADFESGGLTKRVRALIPILIPLFVSAFRRADELALAMECRCYRGGEGRTRMRQLKLISIDYFAIAIVIIVIIAVLVFNWMF